MPPTDYHQACQHAVAFDLSAVGQIELVGPEARMFLHNLCTNDIQGLKEGAGCEAFLTTLKAKTLAAIFVRAGQKEGQPALWIDTPPGLNDKVFQHLNRHLISERVELTDLTGQQSLLRVAGNNARAELEKLLDQPLPEQPAWSWTACGELQVRPNPLLSVASFDLFGSRGAVQEWGEKLAAAGVPLAGPETHNLLRLEAGTPWYGVDIDENRFVVEIGRNQQAISYNKGCYLGQEPIVMARDRGQVNRTLLGVTASEGEPLAAGSRLFAGDTEAGLVTSSAYSPRLGKVIALAYLRRGHQEPGTVLASAEGRAVTVTSLPFVARQVA